MHICLYLFQKSFLHNPPDCKAIQTLKQEVAFCRQVVPALTRLDGPLEVRGIISLNRESMNMIYMHLGVLERRNVQPVNGLMTSLYWLVDI